MGIKLKHLKYVAPGMALKDGIKTYDRTGNIGKTLLDPSNDLLNTPLKKKYAEPIAIIKKEKKKKKQRDAIYASAREYGYKGSQPVGMKHGGKVSCRGMGSAERGGSYGKDG